MRWIMLCVVLIVMTSITFTQVIGDPPNRDLLIQVKSADLVIITPSSGKETDVALANLTGEPFTFAYVDPLTGDIDGGQYFVYMEVELFDAPLRSLSIDVLRDLEGNLISGVNISPETPIFSTVFSLHPTVLEMNNLVVIFKLNASPDLAAPIGSLGTVRLRVALVEDPTDKPSQAFGATQDIAYLLHDSLVSFGTGQGEFMKQGGAK